MNGTISMKTVFTWKTADNLTEWLKTIGLEKYATKFKNNMVTGEILVHLDELLLDDLNITDKTDREILLQSVAAFTGNIEDCIKARPSLLVTSFTFDGENENPKCEPEMEVLTNIENENDDEEKATKFPAFAELLPTIGEEEEHEGEKNHSDKPVIMISIENDNSNREQLGILKEKCQDHKLNTKKEEAKAESNVAKDLGSTTDVSSEAKLVDDEVASRATQIVQVFSEENMCLRKQLDKYYQEIKHLKTVERELRDTQIMYKDLKSAFITREHKEKAMRLRMEAEINQLQTTNAQLTDELKELQAAVLKNNPEEELEELKEEIIQKDDEVKQLQKQRKMSKTSMQNLERMLKKKSSEITILQQQLEKSTCKLCGLRLRKEEEGCEDATEQRTSVGYIEQFHDSMMKSCGRTGARSLTAAYNSYRIKNKQEDLDITTCVPVLVELLKEKDAEIIKLRNEMDQEMTDNKWSSNNGGRLPKRRYSKQRCSDLETEIKSLHVQVAEKDAQIKILKCKYGESLDSSDISTLPFRIPSFTSQSSVSSYQDSGIMTASDAHYDTYQGDETADRYPLRSQEPDYEINLNRRQSNDQEDARTVLSDHCWFV